MKKKLTAILLVVALVLALAIPAVPAAAHVEWSPQVQTLYAGQDIDVGTVSVWNDGTNLYVKYETTGGWEMTETHLHVCSELGKIPQTTGGEKGRGTVGNPIPGQFAYQMEHDPAVTAYTYVIELHELWPPCTDLVIAAHAEVEKCEVESFEFVPELTWQRSSEEAVAVYPGYGAQWTKAQGLAISLDPLTLVWDGGTVGQYFTGYSTSSAISWASWVCTQNPSGKSLTGTDLRRFQATFDIPAGYSVTGGTLGSVNSGYEDVIPMNDNIYIFVNEELIFWGGTISVLDPPRTHFLGMERRPTEAQHSHVPDFPETDGWYMDGTIPEISSDLFVEGPNVLDVFAEELWTGGGMHELGLTLQVEQTTCETETAWGEGERFTPKGNWATYFEYHVQEPFEVQTEGEASAELTDAEAHSPTYSVLLSTDNTGSAARVAFPYNQPLNTITDMGYWYMLAQGNGTAYWDSGPYMILELDTDDNDTADTWVVHHMFADSTGIGVAWLEWNLTDTSADHNMVTGDGTHMWHVAGATTTANINWGDIVTTFGEDTVLKIKVAVGEWASDIVTAHYVDDVTINGVTYSFP